MFFKQVEKNETYNNLMCAKCGCNRIKNNQVKALVKFDENLLKTKWKGKGATMGNENRLAFISLLHFTLLWDTLMYICI